MARPRGAANHTPFRDATMSVPVLTLEVPITFNMEVSDNIPPSWRLEKSEDGITNWTVITTASYGDGIDSNGETDFFRGIRVNGSSQPTGPYSNIYKQD